MKKLYRSRKDNWVTGLCGGIGRYFGIDSTIIRLIVFFSGVGMVPYIIVALIVPLEPVGYSDLGDDDMYDGL